eukprot:c47606_g1_i1 orf=64-297(+)
MPIGQITKSIKGHQVDIVGRLEKIWNITWSEVWWREQLERGWSQKIPRKLLIFWWKVIIGGLPTHQQLGRWMPIDTR